jgi:DNA-binding response OmpR family regulator
MQIPAALRPVQILAADDDADLLALIAFSLRQAGFQVVTAADGSGALRSFASSPPDLVLLDINMPAPDGLNVCRSIREHSRVPIVMLTARDREDDLVAAIDAGADDYVTKPFSPRALLARIRALLRRSEPVVLGTLQAGAMQLDVQAHLLRMGQGEPVLLTPLEAKAMHILMASADRTVTVERLLNHIWGRATSRERRTLKQLIYRLRQKIEPDVANPQILRTTPGAGYRLLSQ